MEASELSAEKKILAEKKNTVGAQISDDICRLLCFLTNYKLEISLYVKLKDWMSNNVDPDETAHDEPSHLDLRCL